MKNIRRTIAAAALLTSVLGAPAYAATFSNAWSFTDTGTGQIVSGTLDGLSNGSNLAASGLTATVTASPYADLLGTYNVASGFSGTYNSYSASNGVVTYANFALRNGSFSFLFFGTSPNGGTFFPQLRNAALSEDAHNFGVGTSFTADAGAVPEPASWAMMIFGMGAVGGALRRRSKVSTTVKFA
jgi:hypothetical protein